MRSDIDPFDNFIFRCQIAKSLTVYNTNINHYGTEKILDGVSGRSESSQIQTRHLRKCFGRGKTSHIGVRFGGIYPRNNSDCETGPVQD